MCNNITTYLLPEFSFSSGAASCFDLFGNFYSLNYSAPDEDPDTFAHLADMIAIKQDFEKAMEIAKEESNS